MNASVKPPKLAHSQASLESQYRAPVNTQNGEISVLRLLVERKKEPIGVDVAPRLSWNVVSTLRSIEQVSYRLRLFVSGKIEWDSQTVQRSEPEATEIPRTALRSNTRYDVSLEVMTTAGSAKGHTWFVTGFLRETDWQPSMWISAPGELAGPAPLLRKEFDVASSVETARLYLAAGGLARVEINGSPVSEDVLSPGFTDYDKQVQYVAWDVTSLLSVGPNAIALELGRGFYGMATANTWNWERAPWHGEPSVRAVLEIEYADGQRLRIVTDSTWLAVAGPTRYDDLYAGENFDANHIVDGVSLPGLDCSRWVPAQAVTGPGGRLVNQRQAPIQISDELSATIVGSPKPGIFILDFHRVIAGWVQLRVIGKPGQTIVLRYGEKLSETGQLPDEDVYGYYSGRFQTDQFTLRGTGDRETWEPRFTWKGFRYVEISGWLGDTAPTSQDVVARSVHTTVQRTGRFASSSTTLNDIHTITVATILNNLHGIPTDTPKFEKNGWTGDGMVGAEMFLLNLDTHELLAKWVDDISDTRDGDGVPKVIAPHGGWSYDWSPAPTWHAAYILIPWWLYFYSGDERVLVDHYQGMRRYVLFELSRSPGHIADTTLGDWMNPETDPAGGNPPEDRHVTATIFLYEMLSKVSDIARVLGHSADVAFFQVRAQRVQSAFLERFYDAQAGFIRGDQDSGYRQSHNVLALAFGLVPNDDRQRVADSIAKDVRSRGGHLNTGALATKYLLPVLTDYGYGALALEIAEQRTFPSWGFWLENGATTLWEHWSKEARSRGHYFLGTIDDWFYSSVAGIRVAGPAFRQVTIWPQLTEHLAWASAEVLTPKGMVSVAWRRDRSSCSMEVQVPVGAEAVVYVPASNIDLVTESGRALPDVSDLTILGQTETFVCIRVGSGRYSFHSGEFLAAPVPAIEHG